MKTKRSKRKKKFKDLSGSQKLAVLVIGAAQVLLLVLAQADIQRRQPEQIRGRKRVWRIVCLINFIGPLSYFKWGRT